ncbi:unnamed protein product [Rotaria magnacalcarata]|nr:unnamed protein product [Rotaria magnacalcarata]CAF1455870.1 unnamed protein product [Rotaria magnacalcarata]CAF3878632.1 unnamed protein product [Rotaria magnacalcarata]CAF3883424.1 unnamed protein product [Rotaria magnacalcarata]CAF5033746.1 unnamed protein product [Rotaria magnacalcarata]
MRNQSSRIWPVNKLIVVPAIWKEINWSTPSSWPLWLRSGLDKTATDVTPYRVFLYQRFDDQSRRPYNWPYCRNVHEEAGVYLQFIYDYYYNLPEKILFLHGNPFAHSKDPIRTALCIRDDVHYTNINSLWIQNRRWTSWGRSPLFNESLMYRCARRLLQLLDFNADLQLNPDMHNSKDDSIISTYCCAQFYVTKQRIHHYTYEQWSKLYHASQDPYCTTHHDQEEPGRVGVKWFGGSLEHLWHVILGLQPTNMPKPMVGTNTDRCHLFRSSCDGSPC